MAYIIAEPCIGVKDAACVEVCPVDCIYSTCQATIIFPHFPSIKIPNFRHEFPHITTIKFPTCTHRMGELSHHESVSPSWF
jgi:NAD-dependent dihydropyrimidine dehydrogenase PreA subunit